MIAQIISALIGLWIMAAPGIFDYGAAASDNGHIIGPVIVTFAVTSLWDATRSVRKWNYPLAVWLLLAPWILGYESNVAIISDMVSGVLVLVFSSMEGKIVHRSGGGWSSLWEENPLHIRESKNQND